MGLQCEVSPRGHRLATVPNSSVGCQGPGAERSRGLLAGLARAGPRVMARSQRLSGAGEEGGGADTRLWSQGVFCSCPGQTTRLGSQRWSRPARARPWLLLTGPGPSGRLGLPRPPPPLCESVQQPARRRTVTGGMSLLLTLDSALPQSCCHEALSLGPFSPIPSAS